jgi:predicted acyl esterase
MLLPLDHLLDDGQQLSIDLLSPRMISGPVSIPVVVDDTPRPRREGAQPSLRIDGRFPVWTAASGFSVGRSSMALHNH